MATVPKAKYKCTEVELYSITNLAMDNLETDLLLFAAKKAKYTPAFITTLRGLRTTAMALPDEEARNGVHQNFKNQLPGLLAPIKQDFKDLQGYIRDAWPNENPQPRYEQAGLISYNKIGTNNWENVVALNQSMNNFIADNAATLAAPGGMPAGFAAQVTNNFTAFNPVYQNFLTSRETSTAAAAKVTANNNLYDAVMEFMMDGVEMVFNTDEANKKRYIFADLKDIVSPPGSASLRVTIKSVLDVLIPDKDVTIKKEGEPPIILKTNADGEAFFVNTDPGVYDGEVDNNGVKVVFKKDVNTGVDARITVKLGS